MGVALLFVAACANTAETAPRHTSGPASSTSAISRDRTLGIRAEAPNESSNSVVVDVTAPPDASELQIGTDPTFNDDPWQPISPSATVPLPNAGYQMIFARFRDTARHVSASSVVGTTSDPTLQAATSTPRRPSAVGLAAPTIVQVTIENGRIIRGGPGRSDQLVGYVDGLERLDEQNWTVRSDNDAAFARGVTTTAVHRVTRPNGSTGGGSSTPRFAVIDDYFLVMPEALSGGSTYVIDSHSPLLAPITFAFDAGRTPSSSIHVNQVGFDPTDPVKLAHLSGWMGSGGGITFPEGLGFTVTTLDGRRVLSGRATRRVAPAGGELGKGDLTGSAVWQLDLSALDQVGSYRICVDGIGCSGTVRVAAGIWRSVAVGVARAMYQQRSGTDLRAPYTAAERPVARGPGTVVRASRYTLLEATAASDDAAAAALRIGATDHVLRGAWGGHFDAGDWDRRIQHLFYVRSAIDLLTTYPAVYAKMNLSIPESGNAIPDVLDEALWSLDLFSRLQQPDGGVSGGINAGSPSQPGSTSWTDSAPLYAYAPDPWSTYIYAGTAAEMAVALAPYDSERADELKARALRAMDWADHARHPASFDQQVNEERAGAAAALYRLTGDTNWQTAFAAASGLRTRTIGDLGCSGGGVCDGAWIYAHATWPSVDATLRRNVLASFRSTADDLVRAANTTLFGWTVDHPEVPLIWGLGVGGTPHTVGLLRAYDLLGGADYLRAAYGSSSVSLGDNPSNTVFVTGFGQHPVRDPLVVDAVVGAMPVWPGIPVYGNHTLAPSQRWVDTYFAKPAHTAPAAFDAPYLWSHLDIHDVAPMSEFTVHQSHGPSLFAYGSLAAESASNGG